MLKHSLLLSTALLSSSCRSIKADGSQCWRLPTLGGVQFWNDQQIQNNQHLQKHSLFPIYRLLDKDSRLMAIGPKEDCLNELTTEKKQIKEKVIILVHGLCRSHHSMSPLEELEDSQTAVIRITYSSLFSDLDEVSANLNQVIQSHDNSEVILVGHSLGGLVIRRWASLYKAKHLRAAVTLGTPHQGAKIVRTLEKIKLHHLTGVNKRLLAENREFLNEDKTSFPIVTVSGVANWGYYLPFGVFFDGHSDGSVRECEAHLPWSFQRHQVDSSHSFLMHNKKTLKIIRNFLHQLPVTS